MARGDSWALREHPEVGKFGARVGKFGASAGIHLISTTGNKVRWVSG